MEYKFEMGYDLFHPNRIIFIFDKIQRKKKLKWI